eukprot:TRINITY_DN96457_c0_g1_i1.p1 TRINITY_DN96457_c0_g1~~TRINITY_DN96457_c0_g1_i1.p1  ORF type:complete len:453 (-),score=62.09 TRINITY_DN96457_c0_g1_i1:125-1483(-)
MHFCSASGFFSSDECCGKDKKQCELREVGLLGYIYTESVLDAPDDSVDLHARMSSQASSIGGCHNFQICSSGPGESLEILNTDDLDGLVGRCLCGAVSVRTYGPPCAHHVCHCEECRRWTGSLGQLSVMYSRRSVIVTGKLVSFDKGGSDSPIRQCCAQCYSCVLKDHRATDALILCAGIFSRPFNPTDHLFYDARIFEIRDSAYKWSNMPSELGGNGQVAGADLAHRKPMLADSIHGRCLCGAVSITATKGPICMFMCHCRECQKWTGSLGRPTSRFCREDIILSGACAVFKSAVAGCTWGRSCCVKCYSCVFTESSDPEAGDVVDLCAGILQIAFEPQVHFFHDGRLMDLDKDADEAKLSKALSGIDAGEVIRLGIKKLKEESKSSHADPCESIQEVSRSGELAKSAEGPTSASCSLLPAASPQKEDAAPRHPPRSYWSSWRRGRVATTT